MEKDLNSISIYTLDIETDSLKFFLPITGKFETFIKDDLDIEPFTTWTKDFAISYWYTKYHILQDGRVRVDGEIKDLFVEEKLNIIWFCLTDEKTFSIKCSDGETWELERYSPNKELDDLLTAMDIKAKPAGNTGP